MQLPEFWSPKSYFVSSTLAKTSYLLKDGEKSKRKRVFKVQEIVAQL
jgi:hypothetical protein